MKDTVQQVPQEAEEIVRKVRERYGRIAEGSEASCCGGTAEASAAFCCTSADGAVSRHIGYDENQLGAVPAESNLGLGCGAPIEGLALQPGEVVLDLGSGGGLDAFLALREVGPAGRVIGVDMTPQMIERASRAAEKAGHANVEFRLGRLEELPVEDASVDAVTSNCVINLVPDKSRVFREVARVLKPGGRLVVSDIVLDGKLPAAVERDLLSWVGCIAGAMERGAYFGALEAAGLGELEILRDVDYLAGLSVADPEGLSTIARHTGVRPEDLHGIVRSVTFRARRPAV